MVLSATTSRMIMAVAAESPAMNTAVASIERPPLIGHSSGKSSAGKPMLRGKVSIPAAAITGTSSASASRYSGNTHTAVRR
jgi:hypothetical protein